MVAAVVADRQVLCHGSSAVLLIPGFRVDHLQAIQVDRLIAAGAVLGAVEILEAVAQEVTGNDGTF